MARSMLRNEMGIALLERYEEILQLRMLLLCNTETKDFALRTWDVCRLNLRPAVGFLFELSTLHSVAGSYMPILPRWHAFPLYFNPLTVATLESTRFILDSGDEDSFSLYARGADWGSPHFLETIGFNQFVTHFMKCGP